jgi:Lrp/AsnC family transcriptional regulator, leucine-responsive regulatory protein
MDATDIKLCQLLLINSRLSYDELASKLGLSINAVHKRVKALIELKIIRAFVARPSLMAINTLAIWIYGRCEPKQIRDAHLRLAKNDSTYWVAYSGGDFVYVGGYLHDISELESYVTFVRNEANMDYPTVGIISAMPKLDPKYQLSNTDIEIISSLHRNSRKPFADIASELHLTARTVRNRLERMIQNQSIDLTIDWYPDTSNDILSVLHLDIGTNKDIMSLSSQLLGEFSPNLLFPILFANIPNQLTFFVWTNTMKQLEDIRAKVAETQGIGSATLNVLQIGYSFDTWRDKLVSKN